MHSLLSGKLIERNNFKYSYLFEEADFILSVMKNDMLSEGNK